MQPALKLLLFAPIPVWLGCVSIAAGIATIWLGFKRVPDRILMMDRGNCLLLGAALAAFPWLMAISILLISLFLLRFALVWLLEREYAAYCRNAHRAMASRNDVISSSVPGHGEYGGGGYGGGSY